MGLAAGAVGGLLAACGGEPTPTASPPSPLDTALSEKLRVFSGWSPANHLAGEIKQAFLGKYGVEIVEHRFDYAESTLAKLKAGVSDYDVLIVSDSVVHFVAQDGLVQPLDVGSIPNQKAILPTLTESPDGYWPDNRMYSVPWLWTTVGIAMRTDKIAEPITGWS